MPPNYAVGVMFNGKDNISGTYDRMGRSADRFSRKTSSAFRNATKEGYKFATIVKGILAANFLRGGIGMVTNAVRTSMDSFVAFDDTIVKAAVKFDDLGVGAKNLRGEIVKLKKDTLALTKGSQFSPVDAANAINTLAASGYLRFGSALTGVRTSMTVATATGEDLASTTGALSDMMGAFGLRTRDSAKEMANFKRLGDVMTLSANLSNVGIMDLKETMEQIGPVSGIVGTNLEEAAAMAAILGNAGIKGTEAATALKNAMLRLGDPNIRKELEANIGPLINMKTGKIRNVSEILSTVYKTLKATGKDDLFIAGVVNKLFGLRAVAGAKNIAESIGEVNIAYEKLKKAGGTAEAQSAVISEMSVGVKLAMLRNAAMAKMFEIFESFNQGGQKGIEGFITRVEKMDVKPIVRDLRLLAHGMVSLFNVVRPFIQYLPALLKLWLTFKAVTGTIALFKMGRDLFFVLKTASNMIGVLRNLNVVFGLLNVSLGTMAAYVAPIAAIAASLLAIHKSLTTGKDNWISELAQTLGLMPKLAYDANGVITGRAPSSDQYALWRAHGDSQAPNTNDAKANNIVFKGFIDVNAPAGTTMHSTTSGAPAIQTRMLGANP